MQPHEKRVLKEHKKLAKKIRKLSDFIDSPAFKSLKRKDSNLLVKQLAAMTHYEVILLRRIARF